MFEQQSGLILREARLRAGLSQAELARRAGTTQSVVSAYESAARQPSLPMLHRLVAATGLELEVGVGRHHASPRRLRGPLGSRLKRHGGTMQRIVAKHGLTNLRVFGSVARGDESEGSDVDLLVDVAQGVGLLGLARCQHELESLLHASVDLVPASDLKSGVASTVLADAVPV